MFLFSDRSTLFNRQKKLTGLAGREKENVFVIWQSFRKLTGRVFVYNVRHRCRRRRPIMHLVDGCRRLLFRFYWITFIPETNGLEFMCNWTETRISNRVEVRVFWSSPSRTEPGGGVSGRRVFDATELNKAGVKTPHQAIPARLPRSRSCFDKRQRCDEGIKFYTRLWV